MLVKNSGGTGITLNANLAATTIVPANYNDASSLNWSATLSDNTQITGVAGCSATAGSNGDVAPVGFTPEGSGNYCYCKMTSPNAATRWVVGTTNSACSTKCGYFCANNMKGTAAKNVSYRTNFYQASGITVQ